MEPDKINMTYEPLYERFEVLAAGGTRLGVSARTSVLRSDFDIKWNAVMETGGAVVSDKLDVRIEIEAVLEKPEA